MKILVCVKQVPDTESVLEIDNTNKWIHDNEKFIYHMNRYDEYALEEAVQIKESSPDTTIDAISVGPERVYSILKKALEKGADNGIHIQLDNIGYHSPFKIASIIASYADSKDYDLILTGVMAEDDMQCQVGPMLAALLSMPYASSVISESLDMEGGKIHVECEMESGIREKCTLTIPSLLTIQSGINRPRYPSLSNVLRAKRQDITIIDARTLLPPEPMEVVLNLSYPEKPSQGVMIEGSPEEKAERLLRILHEKSLL